MDAKVASAFCIMRYWGSSEEREEMRCLFGASFCFALSGKDCGDGPRPKTTKCDLLSGWQGGSEPKAVWVNRVALFCFTLP